MAATLLGGVCLAPLAAQAQDATWLLNPATADFNTATNWDPATVPANTAIFGASTTTAIGFSSGFSIGGFQFEAGAPAYTFGFGAPGTVQFTGAGIVNNSANAPTFNADAASEELRFRNNSTAADATINNANGGRTWFFDGSTAGAAVINNFLGGAVLFQHSGSSAGNATITNDGGSALFHGSGGNATIVNSNLGSTLFTSASDAANADITNNNGGELAFTLTATGGNATITNNAGGLTSFFEDSNAGNATIANSGGQTIFAQRASAGNAQFVATAGSIQFRETSTAGGAAFTNSGAGLRLSLIDQSSAGASTIVNNDNAFAIFDEDSTAGDADITNNDDGATTFRGNSTAGAATIVTNDDGLTQFEGNSSAGNATIVNNGPGAGHATLTFTGLSTAGNATVLNNGTSNTFFTGGATGGAARFVNAATATLDISIGVLNQSLGSLEGAGTIFLGGRTLTLGGNNRSTLFSGVLADGGLAGTGASLVKAGTGTLTLSGIGTYTGTTMLNAGGLTVDGSLAASSGLTVNGGILGGTGTLPSTTFNGGTLAPGNSIGTINFAGNLVLTAASTYMVEVSPLAADRTDVTGNATLAGALQIVTGPAGVAFATPYTILDAAAVNGQFATVMSSGLAATVIYTATQVQISFAPNLAGFAAGNQNQQMVASAIDSTIAAAGSPPAFMPLFGLAQQELGAALSQLSGEAATGMQQASFQSMGSFLSLMLDPFLDTRGAGQGPSLAFAPELRLPSRIADAYAAVMPEAAQPADGFDRRWRVWGSGYGGQGKTDGDMTLGSHDTTARVAGFAAGADLRVTPDAMLGFALSGGETSWGLGGGLGGGTSRMFQAGVHGSARSGPAYLSAALAYAWHDVSTDRTVTVSGTDQLAADFNANAFGGRLETGYRFAAIGFGVTPYAALQVQALRLPGYDEHATSGSDAFALSFAGDTVTDTRSELGAQFDHLISFEGGTLALRSRAAWAHDFDGGPRATAAFQTLPGSSFIVGGAAPSSDLLLASAGAEVRYSNGLSFAAKFDGEFSGRSQSYAGTGTVRYVW